MKKKAKRASKECNYAMADYFMAIFGYYRVKKNKKYENNRRKKLKWV